MLNRISTYHFFSYNAALARTSCNRFVIVVGLVLVGAQRGSIKSEFRTRLSLSIREGGTTSKFSLARVALRFTFEEIF